MTKENAIIEKVENLQADLAELNSILENIHYSPEGCTDRAVHDLDNIQRYVTKALEIAGWIEKERS